MAVGGYEHSLKSISLLDMDNVIGALHPSIRYFLLFLVTFVYQFSTT